MHLQSSLSTYRNFDLSLIEKQSTATGHARYAAIDHAKSLIRKGLNK